MIDEFEKRLCPHRGEGKENTLAAISRGLEGHPYLLEFDVQLWNDDLHLGHPPAVNKTETLLAALELFAGTPTIPKVDIKLIDQTTDAAMRLLIGILKDYPATVLVNISGSLTPDQYMSAEKELLLSTKPNVLLNIDLERYSSSQATADAHIAQLARKPFSISPNLETGVVPAIQFAGRHHIKRLDFWDYPDKAYQRDTLVKLMTDCLALGFDVYFDTSKTNIVR